VVAHDPWRVAHEEAVTDIRVGAWRFVRGSDGKYQCPRCTRCLLEASILPHMDTHDRREAKKRSSEAARELGMGAKALPGQLGWPEFGAPEVVEAEE
jgi:hypothetical protein